MRRLPILFTFSQVVFGNGFIAGVRMSGRALLEEERDDHEVWIAGVAPVGFAGGGMDRAAAFQDFRAGWSGVLFDIAAAATSFADFKAQCEAFLSARAVTMNSEWESELASVRQSNYKDEKLPTIKADKQPPAFEICELEPQESKASSNETEAPELAFAA